MTPADRQRQIVEELTILPDAFERLNTIVGRATSEPGPAEVQRDPAHRVDGCQADLWIAPSMDEPSGRMTFSYFSGSPTVAALAYLFCNVFSGCRAEEICDFEPTLLEDLGLARALTPNRQHGARRIVAKIQAYATQRASR